MDPEDLYQEYAEMIYRFIFLKCNDRDLAEDIVQTTFLKAILQIHSFEGKSKVSTWLCQIARNEYLNYCRKHNRQQSYDAYLEKNREPSDGQSPFYRDGVLERLILSEQAQVVREALHTLKEPYREVFMLRVYGEYSFEEIGESFQKNATWARVTYYRAKEKIKERLEETGGGL